MDWYTVALKRLRADSKSCQQLEDLTGVPGRTIHDIKCGKSSFENVRFGTVKKVAKFYFPKFA